jgi:hypothetical protein
MKRATLALVASVLAGVTAGSCASHDDAAAAREASAECLSDAGGLYTQKIAPLLATDRPKTCNQCHLSGIDLSLFVRDDMCETRACLVGLGLVDLKHPDQSAVLGWIQRAHPDSSLITQDVIDEEYEAFKSFVDRIAQCGPEACAGVRCPATNGDQDCGSPGDESDTPFLVPAGTSCDLLTMEQQFQDTVYVWRDRCNPCHFSSDTSGGPPAPHWIDVENSCNAGSLQTFHNVVDWGLIDGNDPAQSLLLRKPLDARISGVTHGGGAKFSGVDDPSYVSFSSFIEYWAGCGSPVP